MNLQPQVMQYFRKKWRKMNKFGYQIAYVTGLNFNFLDFQSEDTIMQQHVALFGLQILWHIAVGLAESPRACHYVPSVFNVGITRDMTLTCSEVRRVVLVIVVIRT